MDNGFFTGYRKTIVKPQEVLLSIEIPYSKKVKNHHYYILSVNVLTSARIQ